MPRSAPAKHETAPEPPVCHHQAGAAPTIPALKSKKGETIMTPTPDHQPYPVDSSTNACCAGIGTHAQECMAVTAARIEVLRAELADQLRALPDSAPLFAAIDLVTAVGHLRQAARRVERANRAAQLAKAGVR